MKTLLSFFAVLALALTSYGQGRVTALGNVSTGSGSIVLATSPTITTPTLTAPALGAATATSVNGLTLTTGTGTLTIANGALTVPTGASVIHVGAFSVTLTATGTTSLTLPTSGTLAVTASPTFTGTVTLPAAVQASALPTSDPAILGRLWNNAGTVKVSTGP